MAATVGGFGTSTSHKQCTAISKRSGKQCQGPAVLNSPNQKCRMHGGFAAAGAANGNFKNGRYSKYLPAQLDTIYQEALNNPDLLEMAEHIALLEAKMKEVLSTAAAGDPVPRWSDIRDIFAEIETDLLSGDQAKSIASMERMHSLLDAGMRWDRSWAEVCGFMEQLRKMADTEIKRKKELNQMVPIERVVVLMAAVGNAVKRHVTNPNEIAAVYRELAMLHSSDKVPGISGNLQKRVGPEVIDVQTSGSRSKSRRATKTIRGGSKEATD